MPSRSYYLSDEENRRFEYTVARLGIGTSDFARLAVKLLLGDPVPAAFVDVVDELRPELRADERSAERSAGDRATVVC